MELSSELRDYVRKICEEEIALALQGYEKSLYGTVVESVGNKASVEIAGNQGDTGLILNKTGELLNPGDSVKIYTSGNLANSYIGIKCGE